MLCLHSYHLWVSSLEPSTPLCCWNICVQNLICIFASQCIIHVANFQFLYLIFWTILGEELIMNLLIALSPVLWHFVLQCTDIFVELIYKVCEVHALNKKEKHIFSLIVKYWGGRQGTWYTNPKNFNWYELRFLDAEIQNYGPLGLWHYVV